MEAEINISSFDYQWIQPYHSILIIENDHQRAASLINRILRQVVSSHFPQKTTFEQGEIFSTESNLKEARFRFPKRVVTYNKKTFKDQVQDVLLRQAFKYNFVSESTENLPLHFLPKEILNLSSYGKLITDKQFLRINQLLRIPRSFLVIHHCFSKQWPRNSEALNQMLRDHDVHHRLLLIVSCPSVTTVSKELCEQFDWIFYFEKTSTQWKRWYRLAFQSFFKSSKLFTQYQELLTTTQGTVLRHLYSEVTQGGSKVRKYHPPTLNENQTVSEQDIFVFKQLRPKLTESKIMSDVQSLSSPTV